MTTIRTTDHDGGVRSLIFDRPPANAMNVELLSDLVAELSKAHADDAVRALVLTGQGAFFSAGLDLDAPLLDPEATRQRLAVIRESFLGLLTFPKPTVAMVNGHAVGAGAIIAMACDARLGLDGDYRVGLNEVALGAAYPRVAFEIVRLRLTHAQAAELFLGATIYEAKHAVRLGIVDELLSTDVFETATLERAARLGAFPREAYAYTKRELVAEVVARVESEAPEEEARGVAVFSAPESIAAWEAQRRKFGKSA